ncbi:hypothetical protein [Nonomuraea aurantiaca]|uniref:hypothetical protein n=1 Tax=Nonomuraea aurantiaca TaxID=2878562 RepID=UPI001CDA1EDD|nr:hypothetical protein [Nonomuraea aurantiaca]MCA2228616.1 hypothetical protein [Nonomuraea aurantiaca]
MRTEDELSGALRDAADRAPELDLLVGLGKRRRRRTRRRAQLLAAAAVVGVVGTSTVVAQGAFSSGGGEEAAATSTTTRPKPEKTMTVTPRPQTQTKGTPVGKLWPQALFQMPAKNADGWRYRPITGINATEVLLAAEPSADKAGKIEVYDAKTGKSRVVTAIPRTRGLKQYFTQTVSTDGTNVVWCSIASKDGTTVAELWWAPLSGGKAKLAVTLTGGGAAVEAIGVDGESVVWSTRKGGVYRKPFTNGAPNRVPKSDGLHLISWPWAGDASTDDEEFEKFGYNQSKIVNLADGTVTKVVIKDGMKDMRCGPVWCRGRQGTTSVVQRVDGTGDKKLPKGFGMYAILDRFLRSADTVYDLNTGRLARIETPGGWSSNGISSEPSRILYGGTTKGKVDRYWVLNLAAVPPAQ